MRTVWLLLPGITGWEVVDPTGQLPPVRLERTPQATGASIAPASRSTAPRAASAPPQGSKDTAA